MTREEKAKELSLTICADELTQLRVFEALIEMAQWADEHPISGEQIVAMKNEIKFLKRKLIECDKMYQELQNKNPWRDAKNDPPKLKQPVILKGWSGRNVYYESLSTGDLQYIKENPELWPYWMPIPELLKGE